MIIQRYLIHALSPLHAGTGQGVGVIDLPIAREKATGIPYLPGSSVKGVLRDQSRNADPKHGDFKSLTNRVFGPETDRADEHAGTIQISDAGLLLLPVRSLYGTFAWVTSPYLLRRLTRTGQLLGHNTESSATALKPPAPNVCLVIDGCALVADNMVYLEDLDLDAQTSDDVGKWACTMAKEIFGANSEWVAMFKERVCVVHDDVLSFLLETATEVVARIRLNEDTKIVEQGALWYEEALPAETILTGLVRAQEIPKIGLAPAEAIGHVNSLASGVLQFGGNATVGRGLCRMLIPQTSNGGG